MMEAIRDLLHRRPFVPFTIRTSSGTSYDVRHPEFVILLRTQAVLGFPETDRIAICPYLHVASLETNEATAQGT